MLLLPPILHNVYPVSIIDCSKGAQGLTVFFWELRICTENSISLSVYWRQRGSRDTIHARRNLPDKEFRYLRTVRVTAAVYWTFDFKREPVLFGIQHRAGVRPYTSCYHLAESCVFSKQSLPPILCHRVIKHGPPFSKGTEAICRVPSIYLSHRLGALTPIHLCWFGVRLYILIYAISWRTFYSLLNIRLLISVKSFPSHIVYPSVYGIDHYLRGRFTLHRIPCCRNP